MTTHEQFVHSVRDTALALSPIEPAIKARLSAVKLVYGVGQSGVRGVTYYNAWQSANTSEVIEICACSEENWVQLAGTTIHELAHALAGPMAGHSKEWKVCCELLGLRRPRAAGMLYQLAYFTPALRMAISNLPHPVDGTPAFQGFSIGMQLPVLKLRPCSAGVGTRGGKSRGPGSGSRLRKFICDCEPPVIVRAGRDELDATCNCCGSVFHRSE